MSRTLFATEAFDELPITVQMDADVDEETLINDVNDQIDFALESIDTLSRSIQILEEAKSSPLSQQKRCLLIAENIRMSIVRQYEVDGVLASVLSIESFKDKASLVYAIEEEADKGKNILMRMIDAVINAFKWLWDKITGIFSKSEKPQDAEKAAEELTSKFTNAVEKTPKLPDGAGLTGKNYAKVFGFLGSSVTVAQIEEQLAHHTTYGDALAKAIVEVSAKMTEARNVVMAITPSTTAVEIKEKLTKYQNDVLAVIRTHFKVQYDSSKHGSYGFLSEKQVVDPTSSFCMEPVLGKGGAGGLGIFLVNVSQTSAGTLEASFKTKKNDAKDGFKINLPGQTDALKPYAEKCMAFRKTLATENLNLDNHKGTLNSDKEAMLKALDSLKGTVNKAESPEAHKTVQEFIGVVRGIGKVSTALIAARVALGSSEAIFEQIIKDVIKLAAGEKPEEEAKPAEGEAKPAEGEAKPEAKAEEKPAEKPAA